MTRLTDNLFDHLEIKSPCEADWDSMKGNERVRFCGHCQRSVNNLSELTPRQALELVVRSRGSLCLRVQRGPEANARAELPPEPLYKINRRVPRLAAGTFGAALGLYAAAGVQAQTPAAAAAAPPAAEALQRRELPRAELPGAGNATLFGTAFDPQKAVITNVSVTLVNEQTGATRTTKSDETGEYRFDFVEPGSYTLRVEGPGFATSETREVTLGDGAVQRADTTLEVEVVMMGVVAIVLEPSDPLVKAVYANDLAEVKSLIAKGANLNAVDRVLGINALAQAYASNNRDIAGELLSGGADVNARLQFRQTALMRLTDASSVELTRDLLEAGAKVNRRDEDDNTALMFAATTGNAGVVKTLLEAGAKIDAKNNEGKTALMLAAELGALESVRVLILSGASLDVKDETGLTALKRARENDHDEVADLLVAFGATDYVENEEEAAGEP
ncbi:MAG: ankyrin repeat domain-containing protein [Acidobacteria bacterium]|nr:ankyrin repeat domain-containing protein [Acidobacteriota bacterium]